MAGYPWFYCVERVVPRGRIELPTPRFSGGVTMPKVTTAKGSKTFKSTSAAKTYAKKAGGKVSRVPGKKYTK